MNDSDQRDKPSGSGLVGLASIALCVVGIGGAVLAFMAVVNESDFTGAGVCAIASALSFGLLLNAFLRS